MAFKIVVSDGKKSWQIEKDAPLQGKKLGEEIDGSLIGLKGYKLKITGGSDKEGFPMREDLTGTARRKILVSGGTGYNPKRKGVKTRKSVRGNAISDGIVQVNTRITKKGSKPVPKLLGLEENQPEGSGEGDKK